MATRTAEQYPPEHYSGWLFGADDTPIAFDSFNAEIVVDFDGGWSELRPLKWSRTLDATWHTDRRCYFLTLMLDGPVEVDRRNVALAQMAPYGGRRVRLVPPDQTIHSVSVADGEARAMRCFLEADLVESVCARPPSFEERAHLGSIDLSGGPLEWLLLRMYREMSNGEIGLRIALEGIAREIAVEIARAIEGRRAGTRRLSGGLAPWRMRLVLERIHAEGPLPNIVELAGICGLTSRHLGRAFHQETGRTLGRFIAAAMAERAGRMLEAGVPVGAVGAALGYSSSSSFAHAFARETGVLPSSIRDGHRHRGSRTS